MHRHMNGLHFEEDALEIWRKNLKQSAPTQSHEAPTSPMGRLKFKLVTQSHQPHIKYLIATRDYWLDRQRTSLSGQEILLGSAGLSPLQKLYPEEIIRGEQSILDRGHHLKQGKFAQMLPPRRLIEQALKKK